MADAEDFSIPTLFNVRGKVAVVTGGGSGIGTMFAAAYVQNGAKVYIASRKEKQLKEVSEALNRKGPGSCHYVVADLSTKAGCDHLADEIKKREPKVHILVNNSGATWGAPYDNFPEKEGWDRVLGLNVKGIYYLTVGLTELLAKDATADDPGRVINITSIAAVNTVATGSTLADAGNGLWSYNTSKAAANHLTSLLASTLAPRKITVNAVMPGIFPSKMTAFGYKTHGDGMAAGQPMGRTGVPKEMAGIALFLASSASSHVTGAHIPLDGGALVSRVKAAL
ncbi:NAD(P)-dependent dehydrogenase [Phanerochaete sordida]|uniref:NAD(P)-dependent dehydrogenase n=1 Tax=Phanerochaete sordida TaxID=48140 RepID=A0A9P3LG75_9APHY|nr:NAD(P)-dependent dehydrogenase [Phanerochaete sordida]